jgi:superfamily II DNA/RNA helicase
MLIRRPIAAKLFSKSRIRRSNIGIENAPRYPACFSTIVPSKSGENEMITKETLVAQDKRPRFDPFPIRLIEGSDEQKSAQQLFSKLGLSSNLSLYMSQRYKEPTPIQQISIPILLKGHSALLSSQTGSGKTLAFMLPLIVRMQASEQKRNELGIKQKGPRVIIFSPTRELSSQLITQAKSLSHYAKFRARVWGNERLKLGKETVPDLVVTSPNAFQREMRWNPATIESLVIDESDVLLSRDAGFYEEINEIMSSLKPNVQIICVGATALKSDASKWIQRVRPESATLKATGVGDLPSTIKLHMCAVRDGEGYDKYPALERALGPFLSFPDRKQNPLSYPRCIVFCNSVNSCRATAHMLSEKFPDVAETFCLHGEMRPLQREESWGNFIRDASSGETMHTKKLKILVCTDLSSRGIDVQNVQHVIIFDLPNYLPDFLHRAGRTGRAGIKGDVTVIVGRGEKAKVLELFEQGKITTS